MRLNVIKRIFSIAAAGVLTVGMMFGTLPMNDYGGTVVSAATVSCQTWSENGVYYDTGDLVYYEGKVYECVIPHTSNWGWPPNGGGSTLFKERPDLTYEQGAGETTTSASEQQTPSVSNPTVGGKTNTLLIGYYHTWDNAGNPFLRLRDVDDNWDVINISFSEPVSPGSTDGRMQFVISGLSDSYTKDDFKADIKALQAKGKKIVLSIGGYEGYFSLDNQQAINQFVSDITGFVDEYGFDGIDIDLEQSSVNFDQGNDPDIREIKSPRLKNMVTAIRTICNKYGDDFILSWAPETFYVQMGYTYYAGINQWCDARAGSYLPMINALRDITTFVHVQLYNSIAITAPDGVSYSMGTKEATVAMCKMLLDGFYVGAGVGVAKSDATFFPPLRPDQVVIGVPSSAGAAGSGQISNENLQAAFAELNNSYPGMRGIMTWSINWDASQNGNTFAQSNGAFLDRYKATEEETTSKKEETSSKPSETTTSREETSTSREETSTTVVSGNVLRIEGYQISQVNEGFRTLYTVSDAIAGQKVVGSGIVYSLADYADENQMAVGSGNPYVKSYKSTATGLLPLVLGGDANAKSYAMTMKFGAKTTKAFTTKYRIKVFAELENGTYVYSDPETFTVYDMAEFIYNKGSMSTEAGHNYLYDDILSVVTPGHAKVDYGWTGSIVPAE